MANETNEAKRSTPQTAEQMIAALEASIAAAKKSNRDEWSCPCCGTPTDSSYCGPCAAAECGDHDTRDPRDVCAAELLAKGWLPLGPVCDRVQFKDRTFHLCRIEVWRKPDGEVCFGRILEVLS